MAYSQLWYALTLAGTPAYWAILSLSLLAGYLALRTFSGGNPLWEKHRPHIKRILLILILSLWIFFGTVIAMKSLIYIPRPCIVCTSSLACNPLCLEDSSFPSGHAGTIFVVFTSLYMGTRRRIKKDGLTQSNKAVNLKIIPLFTIPLLVSYSRVALGVHTLLDISAGALLGLLLTVLVSVMLQKWHKA
ncbi:MAG TPA: phosphatase PAP2 family protein [archaeon]|nr:phosphatase PAP2 family protein [archaeon]